MHQVPCSRTVKDHFSAFIARTTEVYLFGTGGGKYYFPRIFKRNFSGSRKRKGTGNYKYRMKTCRTENRLIRSFRTDKVRTKGGICNGYDWLGCSEGILVEINTVCFARNRRTAISSVSCRPMGRIRPFTRSANPIPIGTYCVRGRENR